ncbi:hypothetical protein [Saccharothrix sp. ALI-22-I]|uniref:hypothetical protein n=1 Tax=Saccharothrix sp. ALI-22-I TaxID=1933778 RepID=UPI00117BDA96|nr:hypothetical protein [Saccharothrix sp. ALI-22-I]
MSIRPEPDPDPAARLLGPVDRIELMGVSEAVIPSSSSVPTGAVVPNQRRAGRPRTVSTAQATGLGGYSSDSDAAASSEASTTLARIPSSNGTPLTRPRCGSTAAATADHSSCW